MSSTKKTKYLGLNKWVGTDIPQRADFNADNEIVDTVLSEHTDDSTIHINQDERDKWNSPLLISTYYGDGAATRTVDLGIPFVPSFVIIFAAGVLPDVTDFNNKTHYNYLAFASSTGSNAGFGITSDGKLKVVQASTAVSPFEYRSLNEIGTTYICICFR